MKRPLLNVVGAGRVGRTLAALWHGAGAVEVGGIYSRTALQREDAVRFIGAGSAVATLAALPPAALVLVAVPDDALTGLAQALAGSGTLGPEQLVFHCSGAVTSAVLAPCAATGARIASLHPAVSFADPGRLRAGFAGTPCGLEGDPGGCLQLAALCRAIGGEPFELSADDKLVYHAAAVFASNYLTTVVGAASELYETLGLDLAMRRRLIGALARGTLDNILATDAVRALSGPIARGDTELVRSEWEALRTRAPELAALYLALVPATARLAGRPDPLMPS